MTSYRDDQRDAADPEQSTPFHTCAFGVIGNRLRSADSLSPTVHFLGGALHCLVLVHFHRWSSRPCLPFDWRTGAVKLPKRPQIFHLSLYPHPWDLAERLSFTDNLFKADPQIRTRRFLCVHFVRAGIIHILLRSAQTPRRLRSPAWNDPGWRPLSVGVGKYASYSSRAVIRVHPNQRNFILIHPN
jgi:hypothetical protein